jgi:citrate lyase subunit beta / citryl-CoA lyase
MLHPQDALFEPGEPAPRPLPVCDHYAGVEVRMRKSLELQAELGPVFDVTLDIEDGAPVGGELEHTTMIVEMLNSPLNCHGRAGVRLPPVDHPRFEAVAEVLLQGARVPVPYLMIPKPMGVADVDRAANTIDQLSDRQGLTQRIPLHALVETHGALREVQALAAHPRTESLSFGLMDFVSAHRGAIPQSAMGVQGQFTHPLVLRAKLEIAAACHAHGKTPSHSVVTEFKNRPALQAAVAQVRDQLGYTRMWSIHPDQIRVIVEGFAPSLAEIDDALDILLAAQAADWAPIRHRDTLHDRASYRYFWFVLQRAHATGQTLPTQAVQAFFS